MSAMAYEPWTPPEEHRRRWERLGLLRDLTEGAAWGRPVDDPLELARRENRVTAVIEAMAQIAPAGYFLADVHNPAGEQIGTSRGLPEKCGAVIVEVSGTLPANPEQWADSDYWEDHYPCVLSRGHRGEHQKADDTELLQTPN